MSDTVKRRWGWWRPDGTWGDLCRELLEAAGYRDPPFEVVTPSGAVRRVVEEGVSE